jgi:hypothetical protein
MEHHSGTLIKAIIVVWVQVYLGSFPPPRLVPMFAWDGRMRHGSCGTALSDALLRAQRNTQLGNYDIGVQRLWGMG